MKISNAARLIFWVAAIFALGILVRAESGEKRANAPNRKSAPPLRIAEPGSWHLPLPAAGTANSGQAHTPGRRSFPGAGPEAGLRRFFVFA